MFLVRFIIIINIIIIKYTCNIIIITIIIVLM